MSASLGILNQSAALRKRPCLEGEEGAGVGTSATQKPADFSRDRCR